MTPSPTQRSIADRLGRGLTLQLFVFVVLPLTLLLIALSIGSLTLHQNAMRSLVVTRDERAVRAAAAALSEQLHHRLTAIHGLAQQPSITTAPTQTLAGYSFLAPDFDGGLAIFGADGTLFAATTDAGAWRTRPIGDLFSKIDQPDQPYLSPTFVDAATRERMSLVAMPTPDRSAWVVGAFSPAQLIERSLAAAFSSDDQATALLVDPARQVLYQSGAKGAEGDAVRHPGVAEALRGQSGTTFVTAPDSEHVVAYAPIGPAGWALVIEEPWESVDNPLLRTTQAAPLILIPVIVLALIALGFGARQIIQPLRALEQKSAELAWGNFNAIEEPVGGIAEIRRLQAELIAMARKVQLAQQSLHSYVGAMTTGQEDERNRLARELHDDTIQALIALNQQAQRAQRATNDDRAQALIAEMQHMIAHLVDDLRRFIRDLRPIYLEDLGLAPAIEMLTQSTSQPDGLTATFTVEGEIRRLSPERELALYRIVQEALHNAVKHAHAKQVQVKLKYDDLLEVIVSDDGVGFDMPDRVDALTERGHFGLIGMRERAELIGAQLTIRSSAGVGTAIELHLPV